MVFKVICTGKNEAYGKKGLVRLMGKERIRYALKEGIIMPNPIDVGKKTRGMSKKIDEENN